MKKKITTIGIVGHASDHHQVSTQMVIANYGLKCISIGSFGEPHIEPGKVHNIPHDAEMDFISWDKNETLEFNTTVDVSSVDPELFKKLFGAFPGEPLPPPPFTVNHKFEHGKFVIDVKGDLSKCALIVSVSVYKWIRGKQYARPFLSRVIEEVHVSNTNRLKAIFKQNKRNYGRNR